MSNKRTIQLEWEQIIKDAITTYESDYVVEIDNIKEELLSFYYAFFEVLEKHRPFVIERFNTKNSLRLIFRELSLFKEHFEDLIIDLVNRAAKENLIPGKGLLNRGYINFLYGQLIFLIRYWASDQSPGYEKTDVLIEKTVTSFFDFNSSGKLTSSVDLWKFFVQNLPKYKLR